MAYRLLADLVLLLHASFVAFVMLGGFAVLRWPKLAWLHLPAVAWGAAIEFGGWVCPLTPMENRFRQLAGTEGYEGGFIEHYLLALLYPEGLDRRTQLVLGVMVLAVNAAVYAWLALRRRRRSSPGRSREDTCRDNERAAGPRDNRDSQP